MSQAILQHRFPNGLVLLAEPMDWLESAAFNLLVPAGASRDTADRSGLANLTVEMVQRGAGSRDSRRFVEDLELLGADTYASISSAHTSFGGAIPAENLEQVLAIYADVVRRPHLPEEQLEDARMVCIHEIRAIEDDLQQKALQELRWLQYGLPHGQATTGTLESVMRLSLGDVQQHFLRCYSPERAILGVAGRLDWDRLRERVGALWGDWQPKSVDPLPESPCDQRSRHLPAESSQTHIAVGYPSVPYSHPRYFEARAAVGVLSDGMSSRLFTEIRENRGLCYSVYASCHSLRDRGCVQCYAGTTTERAQETLDVLIAELQGLASGIRPDELERLQARIKSALIMQQESSASRSQSIAADWYHLGRVYRLDELREIVDGLTCERINAYLSENPPRDFRVVTLGEHPLEHPVGIS